MFLVFHHQIIMLAFGLRSILLTSGPKDINFALVRILGFKHPKYNLGNLREEKFGRLTNSLGRLKIQESES